MGEKRKQLRLAVVITSLRRHGTNNPVPLPPYLTRCRVVQIGTTTTITTTALCAL